MRIFTTTEQQLIRRLNSSSGRSLYSLIDPWIYGVSFQINTQTNTVKFIFEQGQNLNSRLNEIQEIVIQSVNIIKLFEDNGYIFTFINANQLPPSPYVFGQAATNKPSISYSFPDPTISKLFIKYANNAFLVTPELSRFIKDDFISREEVRANRQYRITKYILFASLFAIIASVVFNIFNLIY
ncbi:MAG: hypothetical protein K8R54_14065 [Bacteroidales bacterium]|nr:hypothetical protein [Bacteroidales bacterium]